MSRRSAFGFAGALFFGAWAFVHRLVYFSPDIHLPHDSVNCYWNFRYVVLSLRFLRRFPDWNWLLRPGMWLQPYANPYVLLAPYRMFGYALGAALPVSTLVSYKLSFLILGQGAFLLALFLVVEKLLRSAAWALVAAVLALCSSATIALLPHEATMGTAFFVPFLWLAGLDLPERPRRLPVLASLAGLSLNNHYPQLLLAYYGVIVCGLAVCPETRGWLSRAARACLTRPALIALSTAAFLVSAAPLLYSYGRFHDRLITRFRGSATALAAPTFDSYHEMAQLQQASVPPEALAAYLREDSRPAGINAQDFDDAAVRSTAALLLALLALLLGPSFAGRRFHVFVVGALAALSCGIYGPMPRLLWRALPGITMFRQWIHFTCFLNAHLVFLEVLVLSRLASLEGAIPRWRLAAMTCLAVLLARLGAVDRAQLLVVILAAGLPLLPRVPLKAGAALACAATILISMRWASRRTDAFVGWQRDHAFLTVFPEDAAAFAGEALWPLTHIHPAPLAEPRSAWPGPWSEGLEWTAAGQGARPAAPSDVTIQARPGGFVLEASRGPKDADGLVLPQFDDGDWLIESGGRRLQTEHQGGPLAFAWRPGEAPALVRRRPSAWLVLVALMWVPLALSLAALRAPSSAGYPL